MSIDFQRWQPHLAALLQQDSIRSTLSRQTLQRIQAVGTSFLPADVLDELRDAVLEAGEEILRLEWNCDSPAGSGYARLVRCADCIVLEASDDWPDLGPFSSLDLAMRCNAFAQSLAAECHVTSRMDAELTMVLATQLTRNCRQAVCVNGRWWQWSSDSLRALDAGLPYARASLANPAEPLIEFVVDSQGMLTPLGFEEPKTRAAAFESEVYCWSDSPEALAEVAERFPPLEWLLNDLYQEAREQLLDSVAAEAKRSDSQPSLTLRALENQLAAMPEESGDGLRSWLQRFDAAQFQTILVPKIQGWLAEAPRSDESDFVEAATGHTEAFHFFHDRFEEDFAPSRPADIGVEAAEGLHPGSDFCAAFLRIPVAEANARASALGLPIRFRSEAPK